MNNYELLNIFPTLLLKNNIIEKFNENIINLFKEYSFDCSDNTNNKCSKNKNILNDAKFLEIKKEIEKSLNVYIKDILKYDVEIYLTQSWLNFAEKGQSHYPHKHPNSFLSGVLYIQADDSITFEQESKFPLTVYPTSHNEYNSEFVDMSCKTGDLVIFPSWLQHRVKENESDNVRISLAFNTFIKGIFGHYNNANQLII